MALDSAQGRVASGSSQSGLRNSKGLSSPRAMTSRAVRYLSKSASLDTLLAAIRDTSDPDGRDGREETDPGGSE